MVPTFLQRRNKILVKLLDPKAPHSPESKSPDKRGTVFIGILNFQNFEILTLQNWLMIMIASLGLSLEYVIMYK